MTTAPDSVDSGPALELGDDGIASVIFDDPARSVNLLTETVMRTLMTRIEEIQDGARAGEVRALLVRSGKEKGFVAGIDIGVMDAIESPTEGAEASRLGQAIFLELEQLEIPTVAAIHGACLGGGLELALACRYRLAAESPSTQLGLPEVQLGILPAWGGTTRLPRLIGLQPALDLLLTGKRVGAKEARAMGLVEETFPHTGFLEAARNFTRDRMQTGPIQTGRRRRLSERLTEGTPPGRRLVLRTARKRVLERTGGRYPAPLKILEVLNGGFSRSVERSLELEALAAGELLVSDVTKSLLHVFRLRESARKGRSLPEGITVRDVRRVGVVGAGVMGGAVAQLTAFHDIPTRVKDIEHDAVSRGLRHARSLFERAVERGKLDERAAEAKMDLIAGGIDYTGFGNVDVVVEAVAEHLDVKRSVFRELEEQVDGECVLTTNTSTLRVNDIAEGLERPERVVGMHFFNPVHRMPLVEVVRGQRSSDEAVATVHRLAVRLGKVPVVVGDGPGFLVNRVLAPYLNEAGHLAHEGATIEEVDEVAREFGMPMGPFRLMDEVGIDIVRHASEVLRGAFGERLDPAPPLVAMGETGRLGVKGGLGFYRYRKGRETRPDRDLRELIGVGATGRGRGPSRPEIRTRIVLSMLNEAARALDEGIVASPGELDLAMILGTGFPPFRGGLLRYADSTHPRMVVQGLRELVRDVGSRFEPAPLLVRLADEDREFYDAASGP